MTFDQLFKEYMEINRHLQTSHEVINKFSRYDNHIAPLIGNMDLQDIKYKDCQSVINRLLYDLELAPKTAKNVLAVIKTVFHYALVNEYLEKNPSLYVKIPSFDNKKTLSLSKNQISSLFEAISNYPNKDYRSIFLFALCQRSPTWTVALILLGQFEFSVDI